KNRNQQLFVTTHSKEMIVHLYELAEKEKFTNLIKVYRLQNVGGEIKIVPYNKEQLAFAISHDEEFR
ncbi:hypothetical protein KKB40_05255, partial [Patescibacteria group bacterium]|nr:hypothetical protein [Patescibacteria group bacterium]